VNVEGLQRRISAKCWRPERIQPNICESFDLDDQSPSTRRFVSVIGIIVRTLAKRDDSLA